MSSLQQKRVIITRALPQSGALERMLSERGAIPLLCPAIDVTGPEDATALQQAWAQLGDYDWLVVTSQNSLLCTRELIDWGQAQSLRIAVVGPKTAKLLQADGLEVEVVAKPANAEALLQQLSACVDVGSRVLLLQGQLADSLLHKGLSDLGVKVDRIQSYTSRIREQNLRFCEALQDGADAILFSSGSTVQGSCGALSRTEFAKALEQLTVVSIGPKTSAVLREFGIKSIFEARSQTLEGMVEELVQAFSKSSFTNEEQSHGR